MTKKTNDSEKIKNVIINNYINAAKKRSIKKFGVVADVAKTTRQNHINHICNMTLAQYHKKPMTMTCHNLCTVMKPLENISDLLGLRLKFCIQKKKLRIQNYQETFQRFWRDVRLKH